MLKEFSSFILLQIFFFCIMLTSYAQQGIVTGSVVDKDQHLPVEFATVTLHQAKDSSLVTGVITDDKGKFSLSILKDGYYFLSVKFLGYETFSTTVDSYTAKQKYDLDEIQLISDSKMLDEVVVNNSVSPNNHKIDKQVYKASQFQTSQGGTAMDVLKNMPSVNVNAEGEISMRGAAGLLVLLNGKPVQSDYKDLLNQIPANSVESVEIITAPSAKYDPDGKGGIVNIVTKHGVAEGISFSANIQGGLPPVYSYENLKNPVRYGTDAILNIKSAKWDINLGGSFLRNDIAGRRVGNVHTIVENRFTTFPSEGERSFIKKNYTGRASVTYSLNQSNKFSLGFYKGSRYQLRRADIIYQNKKLNIDNSNIISSFEYFNSNVVEKSNEITLGNLDYLHTFKGKSTLTITGLYEHANLFGETRNENYRTTEKTDLIQYTINPGKNPLQAYRLKVDYSMPIDSGTLDFGYQYRNQVQKGNFQYLVQNINTTELEVVPEFSSTTNVTNKIHSLYSQFNNRFKKLEYLIGLRYEYATRTFISESQLPRNLVLSSLFPSANLQYMFTESLKFKAGYSKRVQRSTNNELNPYPEREHSETLERGDPDILPEFINLMETGFVKEFNLGTVFATAYHQTIRNVVNRVNSVYNDTILNRIYTNAGTAKLWGIEVGSTLKPAKGWSFYLGGNVYNYQIKGSLFNNDIQVYNSNIVYSINANTSLKLFKTWTLQCNVNFLSEKVTAQGMDSRFVTPNASLKKTFLDGKLSATLQWQNIDLGLFGTNQQRITTWGRNFYTMTNYIQETDIFLFQLGFTISQVAIKSALPNSEFGDKEF